MVSAELGQGEAFYQSEPLTVRLKNLIRDYPQGVGIIKELIQNADDAGATCVEIIFDWRTHNFKQLPDPRMGVLMGAAMLVYNDSNFTDEDFRNIKSLGDSGKRETLWKTGRFGVGFNSIYHVTDYPSFISRDRIVLFDPHANAIPNTTSAQPGYSWQFAKAGWWNFPDFMKVYEPGGVKPGIAEFNGTLFRLPLRTEAQAEISKIRNEPFEQNNVQELLDEFVKAGEEMLIFLKSILSIRVSEITSDGSRHNLLAITTQNEQVVADERKKLLAPLQGGAEELQILCQVNQPNQSNLPSVSYRHTIEVVTPEEQVTSTWRVTSLIRAEGELLRLMQRLAERGEKAVPWAGAAALISRTGNSQQKAFVGRSYCFLPLPQETGLPVHINGFFDLDSSRREMTSDDALTGRDKERVQWNQLLVRQVLSHAYANLLVSLVKDIGESEPERFYGFFPTQNMGKALAELPNGVMYLIYSKRVIRAALEGEDSGTRWAMPKAINVLPKGWESLFEPLCLDGVNLPEPSLPVELENAFVKADVALTVFRPEDLRLRLRTLRPLGMPLKEAPRTCLHKWEWVADLLHYCLSDGCLDVKGLPLAILANGTLQSFGFNPSGFIYRVPVKDRQILMEEIFVDNKNWFLDPNLIDKNSVRRIEQCQAVSMMTATDVAQRLGDLLGSDDALEWKPNGDKIPNSKWLTQVYGYFANNVVNLPREDLNEIPIVPCHDGRLYAGGTVETPLWYGSSTPNEVLDTLKYFRISLIEAQGSLKTAIALFCDRHPEKVIWRLTVRDLIDTLDAQDDLPAYNLVFYKGLVDFLSSDGNWRRSEGKNDEIRKIKLRQLQIYPTIDGQLTDLQNVYTPGGYIPPIVAGSLKLLCLGIHEDSTEWKPFYDFLDVPVLDHAKMIQHLLKDYESLDSTQQLESLAWIRDHLNKAVADSKRSQGFDVKKLVRESNLIRCADGKLRAASSIYNPSQYNAVRQVLGDRAHTPDTSVYENLEQWRDFFQELKMLETPSAKDLLAYVDAQINQAQNGVTTLIANHLRSVFSFLEKNWEHLENEKLAGENKTLFEALKGKSWLPVEQNPENLKRYPGFMKPQNRLYRSDEVSFSSSYGSLVASQKPLFMVSKLPKGELQKALGFQYPHPRDVVSHFKVLIQLWEEGDHTSFKEEEFQQSLKNIYDNYFNNRFLKGASTDDDRRWLRNQMQGQKCLWDYGRFWKPEHTFQVNVPFFGKRRQRINPPSPTREVYELLGQRRQPGIHDYLGFLEELADECGGNALSSKDTECAYEVLQQLSQDSELKEIFLGDRDPLLLTDDSLLLPPNQILIPDAPWRLKAIPDRDRVKILHAEVPHSLAIAAGCRSLLLSVTEQSTQVIQSTSEDAQTICQKWQKLIRSAEFIGGIERLIGDQYGLGDEVDVDWLAKAGIRPADTITTKLLLDGECIASGLQGNYYFEPNNSIFYLNYEGEELMRHHLTESLNQQLGCFQLNDATRLMTILTSIPEGIDHLLDRLKVRKLTRSNLAPISFEESESDFDQIFDEDVSDEFETDELVEPDEDQKTSPSSLGNHSNGNVSERAIAPTIAPPIRKSRTQDPVQPIIKPAISRDAELEERGILDIKPVNSQEASPERVASHSSHTRDDSRRGPRQEHSNESSNGFRKRKRVKGRVSYPSQTYRDGVRVRPALKSLQDRTQEPQLPEAERNMIDWAGMNQVMEYERQHGREPQDMNEVQSNHPGYDIASTDMRSGEVRYIEVKSLRNCWDKRGVCMTLTQFEEGKDLQNQYWLYVVERAETEDAKVFPINNPVGLVKEFYYDDSWQQLADKGMEETD